MYFYWKKTKDPRVTLTCHVYTRDMLGLCRRGMRARRGLSVCLSVRKVYCGKMAEWISMPFGWWAGLVRMGVLDGGGYRQRKGTVLGWIWGVHCNQWGHSFVFVWKRCTLPKLLWEDSLFCAFSRVAIVNIQSVSGCWYRPVTYLICRSVSQFACLPVCLSVCSVGEFWKNCWLNMDVCRQQAQQILR